MKQKLLRWSAYFGVAVLFALACVYLSHWQFDRNAERAGQIELVEANYDASPVPLADVIGPDGRFSPEHQWQPITIRGTYLVPAQLLVRNRPHGGQNTFEVIVPFQADDGTIFLIDRGWVAPGEGELPDHVPAPPTNLVTVTARLQPGEASARTGEGSADGQVSRIDLPLIAQTTGIDLITSAYGQLIAEVPAPSERLGGFESPTDDPGPHLSYAIQWILFAVMGFVFIGYVIRTEIQKQREEAEGRAPKHPRRRRDRDSETEDALLDALDQRS